MVDRSPGFFDLEDRLAELSARGDDLERVKALVDFEIFRPALEAAVPRADRSKGGRPAFDHVLMFKILILQAMHALSDERTEFLIKDRLSFMRFLGLGLADSAVEHLFAHQKGPMGLLVRTIGIARARVKIGMANLAYNIRRFVWLRTKYAAL